MSPDYRHDAQFQYFCNDFAKFWIDCLDTAVAINYAKLSSCISHDPKISKFENPVFRQKMIFFP